MSESRKKWTDFVARYHTDREFAETVRKDPTGAVRGMGVKIAEGAKIELHQNTEKVVHVVIPSMTQDLSFENLADTSAMDSAGESCACVPTFSG